MPKVGVALSVRNQKAVNQAGPLLDEISESWRKIEDHFKNSGILRGVTLKAWDMLSSPETGESFIGIAFIGVQKVKGSWHVCFGTWTDGCPEDEIVWLPVGECSSELRIDLLDHVEKLHEELVESNETYVASIQAAADKAVRVVEKLDPSGLF